MPDLIRRQMRDCGALMDATTSPHNLARRTVRQGAFARPDLMHA